MALVAAGLLGHAAARTASAGEGQGSFQVGAGPLFVTGLREFSVGATGLFLGLGGTWPVSDGARVGLRQELLITAMPYGDHDGEPVIGGRSVGYSDAYEWHPTFLPSTSLWIKLEPSSRFSIDLSVGVSLVASPKIGLLSLLPAPSGGIGTEILLSKDKALPWRLRVQCDVLVYVAHKELPVFFLPELAAAYSF